MQAVYLNKTMFTWQIGSFENWHCSYHDELLFQNQRNQVTTFPVHKLSAIIVDRRNNPSYLLKISKAPYLIETFVCMQDILFAMKDLFPLVIYKKFSFNDVQLSPSQFSVNYIRAGTDNVTLLCTFWLKSHP